MVKYFFPDELELILGENSSDADIGYLNSIITQTENKLGDLSDWVRAQLPGMELTPLDLLINNKKDKWHLFYAVSYVKSSPKVTLSSDELMKRRKQQVSWLGQ